VFVDSLAIVGAPAEPATVVIEPVPVTAVDKSPLPVAVNVAVPVAELRAVKYATPPEKLLPVRVVTADALVALRKLTVEVDEAKVMVSPVPSEAAAPLASVSANLYNAEPVAPVIVVPCSAVIVAAVGVEPVVKVDEVVVKFAAMFAVDNAAIRVLVLYAAAPVPTKNRTVYEPAASGVKLRDNDCVAVESPVAETY